jgi:hypothetical protein
VCATATQLAGNETGGNLLLAWCGMDEGGEQERRRAARCIPQFTTIHSALFTVGASTRPPWEPVNKKMNIRATACIHPNLNTQFTALRRLGKSLLPSDRPTSQPEKNEVSRGNPARPAPVRHTQPSGTRTKVNKNKQNSAQRETH